MSNRVRRVNETIKQELSYLIRFKLKDPRLNNDLISVIKVEATGDLRYAKIFVSVYENDEEKKAEILELLNKSSGFLRKEVGKKLTTYYTPELIFELDDSIEYGAHIDDLLKKINNDKEQ